MHRNASFGAVDPREVEGVGFLKMAHGAATLLGGHLKGHRELVVVPHLSWSYR